MANSRRTKFPLSDYIRLQNLFKGQPEVVLARFKDVGLSCLSELEMYQRLKADCAEKAAEIVAIAASMGIPEEIENVQTPLVCCADGLESPDSVPAESRLV